jgi:hypothetical protein
VAGNKITNIPEVASYVFLIQKSLEKVLNFQHNTLIARLCSQKVMICMKKEADEIDMFHIDMFHIDTFHIDTFHISSIN